MVNVISNNLKGHPPNSETCDLMCIQQIILYYLFSHVNIQKQIFSFLDSFHWRFNQQRHNVLSD